MLDSIAGIAILHPPFDDEKEEAMTIDPSINTPNKGLFETHFSTGVHMLHLHGL